MAERFADVATTIAKILIPLASSDRVGIATPASLTGRMPFIRAVRDGGPRDRLNDQARISIDVLDEDYARGAALAEAVAAYLEPGRLRLGPVLIDRVAIDQAPQEVAPWAPGIFRWEARFTIVSRRHRVA